MIDSFSASAPQNTGDDRWNLLFRKAQASRAAHVFALFRDNGIEPILIKGFAAAVNYPVSVYRPSIDIDLAVSYVDFDQAEALVGSPRAKGIGIDVHRELRHLDSVSWEDLFDNSRLIETDEGSIRVLRPEDHLRVLAIHWLTDGGSQPERLWDIYYAVENRSPDFDWDRCLHVVEKHRRRWIVCAVGLAHKYLDLDLTDCPIGKEAQELPPWLIKTVEREWSTKTKHVPLELAIYDPTALSKQMIRRMRPNPIWATIQMEGSFDAATRVHYQIANWLKRIAPSYRRVSRAMRLSRK